MAAQVLRFLPSYRALAEEIGLATSMVTVRSAVFRRRCAAPAWSKWLGDADKSGGGVFDLLIHDIDFALMLFGMPESVSATGYEDLRLGIDAINATSITRTISPPSSPAAGIIKRRIPSQWSIRWSPMAARSSTVRSVEMTSILYDCAGEKRPVQLRKEDGI